MGSSPSAPTASGRTLGWVRIIETLSDWKLVPVGLLSRLIAAVPDFYAAAPEPVRERVALRYLQESAIRGLVRSPPTPTALPDTDAYHRQQQSSAEDFLCDNLTLRFPSEPLRMSADVPVPAEIRRFIAEKRSKLPEPYLGAVAVDMGEPEPDQDPAAAATEQKEPAPEMCVPNELTTDENNDEASGFSADLLDDLPDIEISPVDSQISVSQHDDQCIVCNQGGGRLLTCSTKFCGLTVHKACILDTPTSFDKQGRFFCPCCACTRAARASERAQEFLSRAKESMSSFVELRKNIKQQKGEEGKRPVEKNVDGMIKDKKAQFGDCDTAEDGVGEATTEGRRREKSEGNRDVPKDGDMLARAQEDEQQEPDSAFPQADTELGLGATSSGHAAVSMKGAENEKRKRKRVNGDANRRHKPRPRYSNKVAAPSRRKILPWTIKEEQVLREGMQKFEVGQDGRISWSTILEFGKDVFHKSRLPIDLKDKWRNMIKREGSVSL